jgi:hypothetical protein
MKDEIVDGKRVRCYDNGGETWDRYTVVYMDYPAGRPGVFESVGMSGAPFHPQGFGQHGGAKPGKHLGRRVPFESLPADCQKLVHQDLTTAEEP